MGLHRSTTSVDGTIPVQALLYDDEEICGSQDGVGIYDGLQKAPDHQAGTVYVSTHRLFYIDARNAYTHSFALNLSDVTQTEYYSGLFKSSSKITLHLSGNSNVSGQGQANGEEGENIGFESWECEVCAYRNPPGLSPAAARVCALCGVPRSSVPSSTASQHRSASLPSSSISTPRPIPSTPDSVACPACTFLNHSSLSQCEICSTALPRPAARPTIKSAPSSRPSSPDSDNGDAVASWMIKLSFRKGGEKPFYTVLKRCLQSKAWEAAGIGARPLRPSKSSESVPAEQRHTPGISGILQTVQDSTQGRETGMQSALQDLEALMIKAKDMVRLAAELNEKLTAASTSKTASPPPMLDSQSALSSHALLSSSPSPAPINEPEEATFIRSSLSQLGLQMSNAPVTLDMIKDERKWVEELARELAGVLQGSSDRDGGGIMRDRGIIALDEVWGSWNRARGVALIPPQNLLQVIQHLPLHTTPPLQTRTLSSGIRVLHTPMYTHTAFAARLSGMLALGGPKTTGEIAREEGVTVGLAAEMVEGAEKDGDVCRDDVGRTSIGVGVGSGTEGGGGVGGTGEVRWWNNVFVAYVWDGQV